MKPLIEQAFWSDPDIERNAPPVKLAVLWIITNSQTNLLGICAASPKRFSFETGLPEEALAETIQALPRAFKRIGSIIFARNYIRHQFGNGEKLTKNNFFVSLKSMFMALKDAALQDAILEDYPEFDQPLTVALPKDRHHTTAAGLRRQILERDEFICLFTGEQLDESEMEADHVIPRSKGGKTIPENLMAVSERMNTLKNNKDLSTFCAEQGFDLERISRTINTRASKPLPGFSKPKDRKGKDSTGEDGEGGKESPERKPNPLIPNTPIALRLCALFNRRQSTEWDKDEVVKFKEIRDQITDEDLTLIEAFYRAERPKGNDGFHRRRLAQFLNHYQGEVDKAREYCLRNPRKSQIPRPPEGEPATFRAWLADQYPDKAEAPWTAIPESIRAEFRQNK